MERREQTNRFEIYFAPTLLVLVILATSFAVTNANGITRESSAPTSSIRR